MIRSSLLISLLFLAPLSVAAQLVVSEVMYDLPGADTGREWIEIENRGTTAVDLTKVKLLEAGVKHGILSVSGSNVLGVGLFAIVADNPSTFLVDNPFYTGALFNSSFSLSNVGETLMLVDASSTIDTFTYQSSSGGSGDSLSLQKNDLGFLAANPTPGRALLKSDIPPPPVPPPLPVEKETITVSAKTSASPDSSGNVGDTVVVISEESSVVPTSSIMWWLALGGVLLLGAVTTYLIRSSPKNVSSIADEYEIVE